MNDIQKNWAADTMHEKPLPPLSTISRSFSAVHVLRKKMNLTFITHLVISAVLLAILPFRLVGPTIIVVNAALTILVLTSLTCWLRFYIFYKRVGRYDMRLRKSIRTITFDMALNIEIYKSYLFSSTGLWVFVAFALIWPEAVRAFVSNIGAPGAGPGVLIGPAFLFFVITVAVCFIINLRINLQYGQQLKKFRTLTEELEPEG